METKRTIIAMVLMFAVMLGFSYYQKHQIEKQQALNPAQGNATATQQAPQEADPDTPQAPGQDTPQAPARPETPAIASSTPAAAPAAEVKTVSIQNELMTVNLINWGGSIASVELADHKDKAGPEGKQKVLLPGSSDTAGITALFNNANKWDVMYQVLESSTTSATLAWQSPAGVRIEKTFTLEPGKYDVGLSVRVVNGTGRVMQDRLHTGIIQDFASEEEQYTFQGPAYLDSDKYEEIDVDDIEQGQGASGTIAWGGVNLKYFMAMIVPDAPEQMGVAISKPMGLETMVRVDLATPQFLLNAGEEKSFGHRLYIGPKQEEIVSQLGVDLERAIDFGWFTVIGKPLLAFLNWLYSLVGNYGIAILILTACVKAIFWPLSAKSYQSMARMKEIAPKVQKLKERYGDDREKLNAEMMHLYKTHKANPLGGCLPMLVQIPVFIALYRVLMSSIELRHAPFALWLHDLSAPDPYYITPIVMGVTMLLQQMMTPATGMSEGQAKLMKYGLPAIFTFMFANFASGLVLYWLTNNVLSILQQWLQMRQTAKPAST